MKKKGMKKKLDGFTLQELLVVLTIIGVLILMAVPTYNALFGNVYKKEAQSILKNIHATMESHKRLNLGYSDNFDEIGMDIPLTIDEGGDARYTYSIVSADRHGFLARAEAIEDFDGDGDISVLEIDETGKVLEVVKD